MNSLLKSSFAVSSKYEAFYTSGKIQVTKDGEHMFCGCGNKVNVLNVQTGKNEQSIGQEDDPEVTSFVVTADDKTLLVALQNLVFKQWLWKENSLVRSWKAIHIGPVLCMAFDSTSTLLASGSSDATIKVWDVVKQYCTHNLRGHQGVVTSVEFHPDISKLQLFTAAEDYKIRVWDLQKSICLRELDKHYSVVTSLTFSEDEKNFYSSGRDSIVTVWSLESFEALRTIPVFESVESLILLPQKKLFPLLNLNEEGQYFMTAGNKGILRIWDSSSGKCLYSQAPELAAVHKSAENEQDLAIVQAFHQANLDIVVVVTSDHNIVFYKLEDLTVFKQFAGYNDEILDVKFMGNNDSHVAVATNNEQIKIFELSSWSCKILRGHTDIVLSVDVCGNYLTTSSKDNTVRLWRLNEDMGIVECVGVGYGHTHAVGAVAFSRVKPTFIVSGSQDCTIKLWNVPAEISSDNVCHLHAVATAKAHEKDINSIVVSPNDKLIATGSQDKTAKLWNGGDLSLLGVMRSHKRGIWCVQFSPVDQCLATASADGTIKIWSLTDFSCVKTFEGHDASVLKVSFLSRGMQLLSSGSDGLVKLWTIRTNECIKTFDEHDDKTWALALSKQEDLMITGGADSSIILWKDVTEIELSEARAEEEDTIIKEQQLSNLLQQKKFLKALGLAITLEQPFRVLKIIKEILDESDKGSDLDTTIQKLRMDQIDAILRFAVKWNTNSKHCHVAQHVISVILKTYTPDELLELPNMKDNLEGLIPYTERHFQRLGRLLQQSTFIDYTWQSMKLKDMPLEPSTNQVEVFDNSEQTLPAFNKGNNFKQDEYFEKDRKDSSTEEKSYKIIAVDSEVTFKMNDSSNSDGELQDETPVKKKRKHKTSGNISDHNEVTTLKTSRKSRRKSSIK